MSRATWRLVALLPAFTCAVVLALLVVPLAQAAPGDLDPTFSGDGKVLASFGVSDYANDVALQTDGRIVVVGGSYAGAGGTHNFALARFNPDGSLDGSLDGDGKVMTDVGGGAAYDVAVQPDGKIVAVGYGAGGFAVARYNPNGSLDASFDGDGKGTTDLRGAASGVALQPDGKIVVVGRVTGFDGDGDFALARYNTDGSLDASFSGDGKQITDAGGDDSLSDVAIELDGTIVTVGGSYCFICSSTEFVLALFRPDGSWAGVQRTSVSGTDNGSSVAIQPDGKIVAAGGTIDDFLVARYAATGSPDPSFSEDGIQTTDFGGGDGAGGVAVQHDGKSVAAGTSVTYGPDGSATGRFAIARYEAGSAPNNLRPPAISGTAAAGQTLTAIPGEWSDHTQPSSYQWLMCDADGTGCANITGATTSTYVLAASDVGLRIRVRETARNANGPSSAESDATPQVSGTVVNLRPPVISGAATEGQTLTVTPGTWSTTHNIARTLQWRQCDRYGANCLDIPGGSSTSYLLLATDVDHTIRVRETAKNAWSQSSVDSAATSVVKAKPGAITGTVRNRKTGRAIANATVNCGSGYSARTDTSGAFLISDVAAPASYTCAASATGYLSSAQPVNVSTAKTATAAFSLARQ